VFRRILHPGVSVLARADDERFRVRHGRIRGGGEPKAKRFTSRVLKAVRTSSAGANSPLSPAHGRGAEKGRGHVAAKMLGERLGLRSRRVVIKARLVVHARAAAGTTAAHLRYIQRDSVTREGLPGGAYAAAQDVVDTDAFEARVRDDRHEFRFIVSPEDAAELEDLRAFTRDLMSHMEADLGTKLDWVAVDHWDTDNPHTHVMLRGVDETGRDLVIARDYIAHGMRLRASLIATKWLGPQTELELREHMTREVGQERWTGLDRQLAERARDGVVDLRREENGDAGVFGRGLLIGRLQQLERLELAERQAPSVWRLSTDGEPTLRAMGERGDIIRTLQRTMGSVQRPMQVFDPKAAAAQRLVGRVVGKGLADELQDGGYLVVDGVDGRAHYVALVPGADLSAYPRGGIVEVRPASREPRPADRAIAAQVGPEGLYRPERHLAEARRRARPGDDPDAFVAAHVRRLEAVRRTGIVERQADGAWRVPPDFLERATRLEAERSGGAVVELKSQLPISRQARAIGATWLDRTLIEGAAPAPTGFGADVRTALEERRAFLVEEGLATRHGQRLVLTRDLLSTLRDREIANVGHKLADATGLQHRPVRDGESVTGVVRRSVMLASGRFAMIDDGVGFSLVPWKPVLEQRLGQTVSGVLRGGSVSWDLSRQRGLGI
jgi:type IV secretory pathway VirD2 relaxase